MVGADPDVLRAQDLGVDWGWDSCGGLRRWVRRDGREEEDVGGAAWGAHLGIRCQLSSYRLGLKPPPCTSITCALEATIPVATPITRIDTCYVARPMKSLELGSSKQEEVAGPQTGLA
ncbi:hypothetical protein M422DRAFT_242833 [Sphaerobolus stellatus SS14]|nr:hypothetical protein M422DRAFT_242805 [Sphaerobolus stellatus SS14]KIJ52887.1 hypothetical protein M422DRAFT_242833 [Sphaerobolus stellatus SS14]